MGSDPPLLFADVDEGAVNALFRRGAGIEIIGKDLVELSPDVDHHLLAVKMGVTEGRGHIDNGPGGKALDLPNVHKRLELAEGEGKEDGVPGADQHRLVAKVIPAGLKGHYHQLLGGKPVHGLLT